MYKQQSYHAPSEEFFQPSEGNFFGSSISNEKAVKAFFDNLQDKKILNNDDAKKTYGENSIWYLINYRILCIKKIFYQNGYAKDDDYTKVDTNKTKFVVKQKNNKTGDLAYFLFEESEGLHLLQPSFNTDGPFFINIKNLKDSEKYFICIYIFKKDTGFNNLINKFPKINNNDPNGNQQTTNDTIIKYIQKKNNNTYSIFINLKTFFNFTFGGKILTSKNENMQKIIKRAQNQCVKTEEELETTEEKLKAAEENLEKIKRALGIEGSGDIVEAVNQVKEKLGAKQEELGAKQEELTKTQEELTKTQEELETAKSELTKTQKELETITKSNNEILEDAAAVVKENEELKKQINGLNVLIQNIITEEQKNKLSPDQKVLMDDGQKSMADQDKEEEQRKKKLREQSRHSKERIRTRLKKRKEEKNENII
mgnify:CR=1 FL=1|tara:strand:+ start:730 stop:2007 length:1278 start_codon:yes stop_codon:yes gene_type:complete